MKEYIYSIYCITNTVNGKLYFGMTRRNPPNLRWKQHCYYAKSYPNKEFKIYRAIRKYGAESFDFTLIYQTKDIDHCKEMERYYISTYNTYQEGYNMTIGGDGIWGVKMNEKIRKMLSEKAKSRWESEELRKTMSKTKTGMKYSEESKRKRSISLKKFYETNQHWAVGTHLSEERKQQISSINKERGIKPSRKAVENSIKQGQKRWVVTSPAGVSFEIVNLRKFCRDNSLCCENLWKVSKGKIKSSEGWKCQKLN